MTYIYKMPDVGEGLHEGEIISWFVKEGDFIKEDEPLLEIQNDKLLQEIPAPRTGIIKKIFKAAGAIAQVGEDLVEFQLEGSAQAEAEPVETTTEATQTTTTAGHPFSFAMPDVGEGIHEGEIILWYVKEGDFIEEAQPLLEIQNDKLTQDILAPVTGKVTSIKFDVGSVVQVGQIIVDFETEEDQQGRFSKPLAQTAKTEAVVEAPKASGIKVVDTRESQAPASAPVISSAPASVVLAMPSIRRYAHQNNVDLSLVIGTGSRGHITKADIDQFLASPSVPVSESTQSAPVTSSPVFEVVEGEMTSRQKMTVTRRAISQAMRQSKDKAAHVTLFDEVEVSKLMAHRTRFKEHAQAQGIKLTYLSYAIKALISVVKKYPVLNASIDDATQEIVYKNYYNIGFATDTEHGLYVPNIKHADQKSMFKIATEIVTLAQAAHNQALSMSDMRDGTITITNIGSAAGLWFTPIINYPEVAILGLGRIDKKPIVLDDDSIGVGHMMALSLSFDHRIVDGMTAQLAMNELKRLLSDPELLLMEM